MRQLRADAEDRATDPEGGTANPTRAGVADCLLDEASRCAVAGWDRVAESLLEIAIEVEQSGDLEEVREGRRFGVVDLGILLDQMSSVSRPLAPSEAEELKRRDAEPKTSGDHWDWGTDRLTVIEYPRAEPESGRAYESAKRQVLGHIAAMRAVFSMHLAQRIWHERGRSEGRLDRRQLGFGLTTDRLFQTNRVTTSARIAVCLLLDESGSMGQGLPTRAEAALCATVLLVESMRGMPGVELEVYSHTSCSDLDRDCLVRYLYGRRNPSPVTIGSYSPKGANYDHQAIKTGARLFRENTNIRCRLMLVLSDGYPSGLNYEGEPAIRATRESVETVRRQGIQIINIAVADFHSEEIYGSSYVVKFVDLSRLVSDLRNLMVRVVRGAVENG